MLLAAALLATMAAAGPGSDADPVTLPDRAVRLRDVMVVRRADSGERIVAMVPAGRDRITLSRAAIASLAMRAVPGLSLGVPVAGARTFVVRPDRVHRSAASCSALRAPVAAGARIDVAHLTSVPCRDAIVAPTAFDHATALPVAAVDLDAGRYLGHLYVRARDDLRKGEDVGLESMAGVVRIVRRVTTMQPSRGRRVFVRDADGQVFAVRRAELMQ